MKEGFTAIKSCPKWYITENGDVWSNKVGSLMSPTCNGSGYLQLIYVNKGVRKKYYIHRLVAETFIGEIPDGHTVNHIDGDKRNNDVSNLEIVTRAENNLHAVEIGLRTKWRGSVHPQAKLTEDDVLDIRGMIAEGLGRKEIAEKHGITVGTVSDIKHKKSWGWLA